MLATGHGQLGLWVSGTLKENKAFSVYLAMLRHRWTIFASHNGFESFCLFKAKLKKKKKSEVGNVVNVREGPRPSSLSVC